MISDRWGYEGTWPASVIVLREPSPEIVAEATRALTAYEQLCRPLAEEDLALEVTKLRAVTKAAREGDGEFALSVDVFLDDLGHFPADLVLWAIRFWRRTEKWFPVPAEIVSLIERRLIGRRAIMDGLRRLIANGSAAP